jgi:uncharacterized protein YecE (DUF72 family)
MANKRVVSKKAIFYCGTSNVELPVPNKSFFPPEYQDKSRLNYYASLFNTVEINSTFYKLPMQRTVEKWADDVPSNFRFTFKLWKEITHTKELVYNTDDVERFMKVINGAGVKKGCLLIQFPASIKVSQLRRVRQLLSDVEATGMLGGWHLAVEFRDMSWYRDSVYEMLEHYKACVVMHDMPKSYTPAIDMERSFVFLRFHGEAGDYRGSYTDEYLKEYAMTIRDWLKDGLPVYAYFNNTLGDAVRNAMTLADYVKGNL